MRQQEKILQVSFPAKYDLLEIFLPHVPCVNYHFFPKQLFLAVMVRRLILASKDESTLDDKDYYGNKRLECAG